MKTPASRYYVPALDGLRFISFMCVFSSHLLGYKALGWMAMELFFMLSAFLLTSFLHLENQLTGRIRIKAYYQRRLIRITPLYYFYVCLILAYYGSKLVWTHEAQTHLAGFLTFTQNLAAVYVGESPLPKLNHLWSLCFEMQVYLVMPLLYLLASRLSARNRIVACLCAILFSFAMRYSHIGIDARHMWLLQAYRLDAVAVGITLALAARTPGTEGKAFPPIVASVWALVSLAAAFLLWRIDIANTITAPMAFMPVLVAIFLGGVLWEANRKNTLTARILGISFMRFSGKISYGLYVYHPFANGLTRHLLAHSEAPLLVSFPAALALTYTMAISSYYLLERPFLLMKERHAAVPSRPV